MLFNIQRWSLHDGPGIRTTVFFKGCPLRCRWCSNPESWSFEKTLLFWPDRCAGCGVCVDVCPVGACRLDNGRAFVDRSACIRCGRCAAACPEGAREVAGMDLPAAEILDHLRRDAVFYRSSGGGVTFSGGEPFAQADLLESLVRGCIMAGIPLAVETSGYFRLDAVRPILESIDDIFIDLKHIDDRMHQRLTGVSNARILENIRRLDAMGRRLVLRVPLIAGLTGTRENMDGIIRFCQGLNHLAGIELMPYHPLGEPKYAGLGMARDVPMAAPDPSFMAALMDRLAAAGVEASCADTPSAARGENRR